MVELVPGLKNSLYFHQEVVVLVAWGRLQWRGVNITVLRQRFLNVTALMADLFWFPFPLFLFFSFFRYLTSTENLPNRIFAYSHIHILSCRVLG